MQLIGSPSAISPEILRQVKRIELRTRGLEEKYKRYILKSADGAFELVAEQLGSLAGRMFDAVNKQTETSEG